MERDREREKELRARKSEIKKARKSEWRRANISTLISIPLLPRNINNAAPKETDANRHKAASSLTLGLICAESVAGRIHIKKKTELWD